MHAPARLNMISTTPGAVDDVIAPLTDPLCQITGRGAHAWVIVNMILRMAVTTASWLLVRTSYDAACSFGGLLLC